jgi:hypothetical protein
MFDLVKKVTLTSLMCTTLFFSAQSSAEIIDADWLSAGDKNAVIDTDTGLHWLDITLLIDILPHLIRWGIPITWAHTKLL